jgi:hypothetical protein
VDADAVSSARQSAVGLVFVGLVFVGAFGYAVLHGPAPAPAAQSPVAAAPAPVPTTAAPSASVSASASPSPSAKADGGTYATPNDVFQALAGTPARCDQVTQVTVSAADRPGVREAWCMSSLSASPAMMTVDVYDPPASRDRELPAMLADVQARAGEAVPPGLLYGLNWIMRGPAAVLKQLHSTLGGTLVPSP